MCFDICADNDNDDDDDGDDDMLLWLFELLLVLLRQVQIRANSLSGDCRYTRELRRGFVSFSKQHQVRERLQVPHFFACLPFRGGGDDRQEGGRRDNASHSTSSRIH